MSNGTTEMPAEGGETKESLKRPLDTVKMEVDSDEEDDKAQVLKRIRGSNQMSKKCPYLDTIDRTVLDFDFEKFCSISFSRINVYACLVCGKYFQGRGAKTHAYTHSVETGHRVFLNLETKKFYCLPDNYEIIDPSLADIVYVLNPTYTLDYIKKLDTSGKEVRSIHGDTYLPGIVGLNNIKANDYCNVILQALSHVKPIRNYFLDESNYSGIKRKPGDISFLVVQRFGELLRKLWNPKNFKSHVSPHEMLQAVVLCSKKKFQITEQGDSVQFLSWLLNALHLALGGTKKIKSSVIYKTFSGSMNIQSKKILPPDVDEEKKKELLATGDYDWKSTESPFLYLTAELPPPPLFKDEVQENIIPQVSLYTVLGKFNGETELTDVKSNTLRKFKLTRLPPYIILYMKRFTKNTFYVEKNPTIVNFPIKAVEFGGDLLTEEAKQRYGETGAQYDLISNIVHEGKPDSGAYKLQTLHQGSGKWFEMQDLHVDQILPETLPLSEAFIQIYELSSRRDKSK